MIKGATEYTEEDYSTIMKTNVESPYNLSQLAHPFWRNQELEILYSYPLSLKW